MSAIFAFCTRQIVLGCLIFAYAQMQLSELLIWHGLDTNNSELNKKGTSFGKYLLATHNFAIGLGIILYIVFVSKKQLKLLDFLPIIAGFVFFICIILFVYLPNTHSDMTFPRNKTSDKSCQNPENRLQWPWSHSWYIASFILSILIMFVYIKPDTSKYITLLIYTISWVVVTLIYPSTVGSVWCFVASVAAPIIVVLNYYVIRNKLSQDILV